MNKLNKEQVLQIKDLRADGKTTSDISKLFGVSEHTIGYWIKRLKASGYQVPSTAKRGKKAIAL